MRRKFDGNATTSPSIAKLYRAYKIYIIECITKKREILSLKEFYFGMRIHKNIPKSMTYEEYLSDMNKKEFNAQVP